MGLEELNENHLQIRNIFGLGLNRTNYAPSLLFYMSFRRISVPSLMIAYYKWKVRCLRPLSACVHIFMYERV